MVGVSSCGGGRRLSLCGGDLEGFFVWGGVFMWRRVSLCGEGRRVSLCGESLCGGEYLCVAEGVFVWRGVSLRNGGCLYLVEAGGCICMVETRECFCVARIRGCLCVAQRRVHLCKAGAAAEGGGLYFRDKVLVF